MMTKRFAALAFIPILILLAFPLTAWGSAVAEGYGEGGRLPPPPVLTVLDRPQDAGKRIAISWEAVERAYGYRVYRSCSADGEMLPVGGRAADSMSDYPVFLDDSAEPGVGYYYAVATVDGDLREGPLSPRVYAFLAPVAQAAGGPKSMTCSLSDQRIYFFEGDQLVNIMRCSTGLRNATPTGHFRILAHYRVHVGLGGAVCDYWMSFTSRHGMHSWPRGSRSNYETGLGAPASHGCIRLHPLEAYWPYQWAPNGTPLTITYASLARRVVSGCHDATGAVAPSRDWYFAEGYTAQGFDTFVLVANPGERAAAVEAEFMKEDASVVRHSFTVPPHTRHTITVDDVWGMDATAFSLHLRSSEPVVAERAVYFRKGYVDGGHASLGATSLSKTWYFAEGCTRTFFEDYLLVGNPGDRETVVHVEYHLPETSVGYDYPVAARSRLTIPVHSQPGLAGTDVACTVTSGRPVVAERAMYYALDSHRGGHATLGAQEACRQWYFAEGYTDKAFDTYILLSNPGASPASVEMAFHREDGSVFTHSCQVPPRRRVTVRVDDLPGLERASFATLVRSDQPVVAERAMYFVMPRGY